MKRKLLWFVGAFLVLAIAFLILGRDEDPPNLSEFSPVRRDVPESSNGFAVLRIQDDPVADEEAEAEDEEAHLARSGPLGFRGKPGLLTAREREACSPALDGWDPGLAWRVIDRCDDVLRGVEEALGLPAFQVPRDASPTEPLPYLMGLRDRAHLLEARSALRIEAGEDREGFEDAGRLVRFGRAIQRSQGNFLVYIIGLACEGSGLELFLRGMTRTKRTAADLRPLIARLEPLRADRAAWKEAVKADFAMYIELIDRSDWRRKNEFGIPLLGSLGGVLFKPNQTKRLLADLRRRSLGDEVWEKPFRERNMKEYWEEHLSGPINLMGKRMVGFLGDMSQFLPNLLRTEFQASAVKVALAVKGYREAKGSLPDSLAELVPEFLEKIPEDPFDGKPLRYSKEKKLLWSVGRNLEDDGGAKEGEDGGQGGDDLAAPMEF